MALKNIWSKKQDGYFSLHILILFNSTRFIVLLSTILLFTSPTLAGSASLLSIPLSLSPLLTFFTMFYKITNILDVYTHKLQIC